MTSEDAACPACGTPRLDEMAHASDDTPEHQPSDEIGHDETSEGELEPDHESEPEDGEHQNGGADAEGEIAEATADDVISVGDSAEGEAVDAPAVPAGTWASTSESDSPPVPNGAFEREPDTRRVRRVRDDEGEGARPDAHPIRARGAATPREAVAREAVAREAVAREAVALRAGAVPRSDALVRAQRRVLTVAPAEQAEEPEPHEEEPIEGEVVALPAQPASATASSSGMRAPLVAPAAPKWLASEILREPAPTEPAGWTSRAIATAGGIAGAAASLVIGNGGPDLGMAGLFVALAGLAIVPLPFPVRAGGFAVIASLGLSIATWARIGSIEGEAIGLATLGTTLLAAAQLLRAVQRRSKFAKAASMLGITVTGAWLALDGGLSAMVVHGDSLDAWLPPLVRAALMIVLALSLLGFLDDSGTSGNHVWPWLVLGWSALQSLATIATLGTDQTLATAATPVFAAIAALGWMQVWATTPGLGLKEPARARTGDG